MSDNQSVKDILEDIKKLYRVKIQVVIEQK